MLANLSSLRGRPIESCALERFPNRQEGTGHIPARTNRKRVRGKSDVPQKQ